MTSTEGLIWSHGPTLFWFGLFWHGTYQACPLLQATSGEKWEWRRPHAALGPSPGNPGGRLCCPLCCPLSPAALTSPSCPERGWETPNFCSHYGYHTAWVFCNKLSFLPLSLISINIPNILKFQHHLEGAKEIRRRGSGPSVTEPMTGGPSWLVQGHPAMVRGCFLWLAFRPVEDYWTVSVLSCPLAQKGPLWHFEHDRKKELANFFSGFGHWVADWLTSVFLFQLAHLVLVQGSQLGDINSAQAPGTFSNQTTGDRWWGAGQTSGFFLFWLNWESLLLTSFFRWPLFYCSLWVCSCSLGASLLGKLESLRYFRLAGSSTGNGYKVCDGLEEPKGEDVLS